MNTNLVPMTRMPRVACTALVLTTILAGLLFSVMPTPAGAGYTNEHMESPYNDDGHPRSWIRITGTCEADVYCETRYKIQYSYWGWRTSSNSEVIATPNRNTWTRPNATCNKSPGTYRGRMDMKYVNSHEFNISVSYGLYGTSINIPALTTHWVKSSSPHTTGLECGS